MSSMPRTPLHIAFPAKPVPAKLAHVVLRTPRFDEMKRFYSDFLGATPAYENEQICFMTYDEEHHRVGLINWPHLGDVDKGRAGMEHVAFTYPDLGSLLAAYSYNKENGIQPYWTINHGPTISMYYRDPDGNKIELQYDVFDDPVLLDAFFSSDYIENFMGVIFDPDKMVTDYEAGSDIDTLTQRPKLQGGSTPWDMHRD